MYNILLLGAGKIGTSIAKFLCGPNSHGGQDYKLRVVDHRRNAMADLLGLDIEWRTTLNDEVFQGQHAVISALPYFENRRVADLALKHGVSYFDLTEDVETTKHIENISSMAVDGQIFMPQCGLAPGFIGIAAHTIAKEFDVIHQIKMRVGALPKFPTNKLKYNLTWSVDGLINEYIQPCDSIHNGQRISAKALEGLEYLSLDGSEYEAFNTSGGLGTLCETFFGEVQDLDYKTIRYPGHRDLMAFLINDLNLGRNKDTLKKILEDALPATKDDVVITFVSVNGYKKNSFVQVTDARKIYSQMIGNERWTGIQVTTAAGICTAVDMFFAGKLPKKGFVCQEDINLDDFLSNRFGRHYRQ